jgi:hypothetical protein
MATVVVFLRQRIHGQQFPIVCRRTLAVIKVPAMPSIPWVALMDGHNGDFNMASNDQVKAEKNGEKSFTSRAIEPAAIYSRAEAARVAGVSQITLWRALERGDLSCYRRGRRVLHSGQHLLDWLRKGECP